MSDPQDPIGGSIAEVIAKILDEVACGTMSQEQANELIQALNHNARFHRHDVSLPYRVGLMALGREDIAMRLGSVHMILTTAGAMYEYGVRENEDDPNFMEYLESGLLLQVSAWVLRAGFIDAVVENGTINLRGSLMNNDDDKVIAPDDVETLVKEFVKELNEEFPDDPPSRKGSWW